MQINLPQDLHDRIFAWTAAMPGCTEADVIRKALDALDWSEQERQAIQEGIDAWRAAELQSFDKLDRDICSKIILGSSQIQDDKHSAR